MTETIITLSEDEKFTILSHPIRRRILKHIFEYGFISFSTISKEWGVATGTLYHHLKALNSIIYQNEQSHYCLNDEGHKLVSWFLKTDSILVSVKKVDSFTILMNPIHSFLEHYTPFSHISSLIIILIGLIYSSIHKVVVVGPFITQEINTSYLIFNILTNTLLIMVITLLSGKSLKKSYQIVKELHFGLFPPFLLVILIFLLKIQLSSILWMIVSFILQFVFMSYSTSVLARNAIKVERSILIVLFALYFLIFSIFYLH